MLTPEEIQSREFLVSLRGYDRDEVHAFLGRVAEQLAQTEAKAQQLQQRLDRLKAQQGAPSAEPVSAPAPTAATSPEPSAMFAEIGKETQRILEAAQEAGQQIQRKARQEADRDLQSARSQAAKLIAEGERRREHIERVVSELEQARAAMSVQLRGVGRTIEQTLKELAPNGAGSATVREALGAQAGQDAARAERSSGDAGSGDGAADADAEPDPGEPAEVDQAGAAQASAEEASAPAAEQAPAQETAAEEGQESLPEKSAASSGVEAEVDGDADGAQDEAADAPAEEEAIAPAPAAVGDNTPADAGSTAADVAGDEDESVAAAPAPAATEPAMPPDRSAAAASAGKDPQGLRAAALSPLHPKLVRKVKRELQEIQNIALDKVRRAKGKGEVDDFLPASDDTAGLGEGSEDLLRQAWQAGVTAAATLAERPLDAPDDTPDLASLFREDATERVRSGLAATLKMGLSAEEGAQALSDRIGSVFSDFKGAQSEELAATHLIRAYEQGLLGAWTAGGISARRWVMGREPRCPEARCRHNDQSGAVDVTQAFPSGHDVPPVHVGCTCTTIPAEESSA